MARQERVRRRWKASTKSLSPPDDWACRFAPKCLAGDALVRNCLAGGPLGDLSRTVLNKNDSWLNFYMVGLADVGELADSCSSQQKTEWQRTAAVYARQPQVRLDEPVEDDCYHPENVRG